MASAPLPAALADTSTERLQRFFDGLHSLQARFEQIDFDQEGRILQRAQGQLHVMRPGRFRWEYETPYEQLIVTDGTKLWIHEPDLEQVTISELDTSVGNTPALLLSTDQPLEELFQITGSPLEEEPAWVSLEPEEEANFSHIFLAFDETTLTTMEIVDGLGQTVQIHFTDVRRNQDIDPALFEFTPPEDADVIGDH